MLDAIGAGVEKLGNFEYKKNYLVIATKCGFKYI